MLRAIVPLLFLFVISCGVLWYFRPNTFDLILKKIRGEREKNRKNDPTPPSPGSSENGSITMALVGIMMIMFLCSAIFLPNAIGGGEPVKIATGGPTSRYTMLANTMSAYLPATSPMVPMQSNGSEQSLSFLNNPSGDILYAIVQGDSVKSSQWSDALNIIAYGPIEVAHIVVEKKSGITSLSDLRGKKIQIGPIGSGSYITFIEFQKVSKTFKDMTPVEGESSRIATSIMSGDVHAGLFMAMPGHENIRKLDQSLMLIPVDDSSIGKVQVGNQRGLYEVKLLTSTMYPNLIPKGLFGGINEIKTYGVRCCLIGVRRAPNELTAQIQRAFESASGRMSK